MKSQEYMNIFIKIWINCLKKLGIKIKKQKTGSYYIRSKAAINSQQFTINPELKKKIELLKKWSITSQSGSNPSPLRQGRKEAHPLDPIVISLYVSP